MCEWASSNFRLLYDGVNDEDTASFTVDTINFPELESGRTYRFKVRAVNYCSTVDPGSVCYGDFSESTAYTVRYRPRLSSARAEFRIPFHKTLEADEQKSMQSEPDDRIVPTTGVRATMTPTTLR